MNLIRFRKVNIHIHLQSSIYKDKIFKKIQNKRNILSSPILRVSGVKCCGTNNPTTNVESEISDFRLPISLINWSFDCGYPSTSLAINQAILMKLIRINDLINCQLKKNGEET